MKNTESARAQMEELARVYQMKIRSAQNAARGLSADTFGAPTLEQPTLTKGTLTKKRFAEGGEAKKSDAKKAEAMSQLGRHQRRVQIEAKRNQRKLERLNRDYNRRAAAGIGKGVFLPDNIVQMIKDNNIQGVLQYLRTNQDVGGPHKKIFKALAQTLFNMKLKVKIELVDSLPDNRLAEYDPSYKDPETGQLGLISVTPDGLTTHTVLHEIIHAGTLKVLFKYLKGDLKSLTPEQRDACDQLQDIMDTTREALSDSHPNAYESLIEFVSYALTDTVLQEDLATFDSGQKIEATVLPESKGKWSSFKLAIAGILDIAKVYFRQNKVRADAPVNYFLEVSAAMEDILSPQDEQIYLPKNLAATAPKSPLQWGSAGPTRAGPGPVAPVGQRRRHPSGCAARRRGSHQTATAQTVR
jgi:hypothetical protein